MSDDQVGRALSRLWQLLQGPELSSGIAGDLGRAVRQLDEARLGSTERESHRELVEGLSALQAVHQRLEESPHASDRAQLAAVKQALQLLEAVVDARTVAASATGGPGRDLSVEGGEERELTLDQRSSEAHIQLVGALHRYRVGILEDPGLRWQTFSAIDGRVERATLGLRWIAGRGLAFLDQVRSQADEPASTFDPVAASLQLGDAVRIGDALRALERDDYEHGDLPGWTLSAMSIPERREVHEAARALFGRTESGRLRSRLVPWLFERQLLPPADLVGLLSGIDDATATAAAELVVWVAGPDYAPLLFDRGVNGSPGIRSRAFLRAGCLLGSRPALEEIRRRLDAGEADSEYVGALAAMGDGGDVARLQALAGREDAPAALLVLAAEHLGGERTVESALAALLAPASAVHVRCWAALHIAARTGHRLGAIYRPDATARRQDEVARAWAAYLRAPQPRRLGGQR